MENKQFLSEEAKKKIAELQSEISQAKEKIKLAMSDDIGVNYIINTDKKAINVLNFSASLNVIPVYLEIIKNCYACMDEIVKKSIEAEKHNKEKENESPFDIGKSFMEGFFKFCDRIEQIKIGDRVKLKGDSNSPEMTVIGNTNTDSIIYSITSEPLNDKVKSDVFRCAWFIKSIDEKQMKVQIVEIHKDALKKLTEVQSINKQ